MYEKVYNRKRSEKLEVITIDYAYEETEKDMLV